MRMQNAFIDGYILRFLRSSIAPILLIILFVFFADLRIIANNWQSARGFEYERIGRSIAEGNGFSFPGGHRWLFPGSDPAEHFITAWEEPFFPYYIGLNFYLLGEHARISILILNALFFCGSLFLIFSIAKNSFGLQAGYVAALSLALLPKTSPIITGYLGNSAAAAFLILASAQLIIWLLDRVSIHRAAIVGCFLGLTALTHAGTLLFGPFCFLLIVASAENRIKSLVPAITLIATTMLIIAPWAIRNYLSFNEFVPVRSGLGQIMYVSNVALSETFQSNNNNISSNSVPWKSKGPWDAWKIMQKQKKREQLERYAEASIEQQIGIKYRNANEAGRDKILLSESKKFIVKHPKTFFQLSAIKAASFLFKQWPQWISHRIPICLMLTCFAFAGALLGIADNKTRVLVGLTIAYVAPYMVTAPYFYRYRFPIEPLIILLASVAIVKLAKLCRNVIFQQQCEP